MKEGKSGSGITTMQFIFTINGVQLGMGNLQFPRILSERAGADAWLSVIFGGLLSTMVGLLVIQIMKKNPDRPLPLLLQHYFGKWLGTLLAVIFIVFFIATALGELLRLVLFVKVWLLPETPDYFILAAHLVPAYILISGGIRNLARYSELTFYLALWLPAIYLFSTKDGDWLNLLPFLQEGLPPVLQGTLESVYSFFGSELALVLYPMLNNKKYASMAMFTANLMTLMTYLGLTVVCLVFFGQDDIVRFNEPTISVLKVISFRFIERIEILVFAFYLIIAARPWMVFLWSSTYCIGSVLNRQQDMKKYVLILLCSTLAYVSFFDHTFSQNDQFIKWVGYTSILLAYLFPIMLFGYSLIFDRLKRNSYSAQPDAHK